MLSAKGNTLIAGSVAPNDMTTTIKIKVLRPFYYKGQRKDVGSVFDYPYGLALEAIQLGKAERVQEKEVPALVKAPEPKGERDGNLKRG